MTAIVQSSVALSFGPSQSIICVPYDDMGVPMDTITLQGNNAATTAVWGSFTWGSTSWGSSGGVYRQYPMNWNLPLVFKQMSLQITGSSTAAFAIGNLYGKVRRLGYMLEGPINP